MNIQVLKYLVHVFTNFDIIIGINETECFLYSFILKLLSFLIIISLFG